MVSGPSGVGKDTVLDVLIADNPTVVKCTTVTTRAPRSGEANGIDYFFVTREEFVRMIDAGEFVEYADVHGNLYGTPVSEVNKLVGQGLNVILKIDVQGAFQVRKNYPGALLIFILPPSMEELEKRLRGRNTDNEESILKRLENALGEIQSAEDYDYVVENVRIDDAVHDIEAILVAEKHRVTKK